MKGSTSVPCGARRRQCSNGTLNQWRKQDHDRQHGEPSQPPSEGPLLQELHTEVGQLMRRDSRCDGRRDGCLNDSEDEWRVSLWKSWHGAPSLEGPWSISIALRNAKLEPPNLGNMVKFAAQCPLKAQYRVVKFSSQSGMAFVKRVSAILSRPVRTNKPTEAMAIPMTGLAAAEARRSRSRRRRTTCLEP